MRHRWRGGAVVRRLARSPALSSIEPFRQAGALVLQSRFAFPSRGPVAQLGARLNGIQEVTGSIPVRSTTLRSPASVSELRVASQPSRTISGEGSPSRELTPPDTRRVSTGAPQARRWTADTMEVLAFNRTRRSSRSQSAHSPRLQPRRNCDASVSHSHGVEETDRISTGGQFAVARACREQRGSSIC